MSAKTVKLLSTVWTASDDISGQTTVATRSAQDPTDSAKMMSGDQLTGDVFQVFVSAA